MAGGHIQLFNQLLEFLNHGAVVGDDQGVGGRVDQGAAAAAQQGVAVAAATGAVFINAQNFAEFFYVFVFQLEGLREKRPQLFDFFLRLQGGFVLIQQFFARGDIDDIALAAHIEIARLHYQIQRLIPRHIFQAEGHFAVYAVAGHNIHARFFSQNLQNGAHVYILEIQRNAAAAERFLIGSRAEAARFDIALLADFKAVTAVARLGAHIPAALVADGELGVVADALESDVAHGGVEIRHIQAALCLGGQRVVFQGDHQAVALLLDVGLAGKGGGVEFDDA